MNWTTEQVLALAPGADSAKDARKLTDLRKWVSPGRDDESVWGECQGSAKTPYRVEIDLTGPGFHCTCPSRKFPCKHSLALFLLLAESPTAFTQNAAPTWVTEWIAKRRQSEQQKAKRQQTNGQIVDAAAQAKRADKRQAKVEAGLREIDLWLTDIARRGLADVQGQSYGFWDNVAARMVDAQAPGLARRVREMAGIPASGEGWPARLLEQLARLHLLIQGYQRLDMLPPDLQFTIRSGIGWTQDQDEVLDGSPARDHWIAMGQRLEEQDRLKARYTWLSGKETRRSALVLEFSYNNRPFDVGLAPGLSLDAGLVFYPGAYPLRAVIRERHGTPVSLPHPPPPSPHAERGSQSADTIGFASVVEALEAYSAAITCNPWLELFPMAFTAVIPIQHGDRWLIRDTQECVLPITPRFQRCWQLLAISGGHPVGLFGEWDGDYLLPLSVWTEGRWVNVGLTS